MKVSEIDNKDLKRRILEISHKHKLSHIGSCITAVSIINEIFRVKKKNERFVLSSGHAGLALYVVLEKYNWLDAEAIFLHHGVHPDRCFECGLDCSAGSLGNGLPIAVGMALADRRRSVYCLISDGEAAEGSIWEALRIMEDQKLHNLKLYVNANGWGAYGKLENKLLKTRIEAFIPSLAFEFKETDSDQLPFLNGLDAHYHVMSEDEYNNAMEILR